MYNINFIFIIYNFVTDQLLVSRFEEKIMLPES